LARKTPASNGPVFGDQISRQEAQHPRHLHTAERGCDWTAGANNKPWQETV